MNDVKSNLHLETDPSKVTDKLYHIMLCPGHLDISGVIIRNFSELNPTTIRSRSRWPPHNCFIYQNWM
jgi:hypothetical protein